ncbi:putative stage IV sporulation protein [Thermoanaerobacter kivui]|uniref:Putative stage IV sporulation protein n=1 Tax=Thermoanaerobacter kivui TaxID=2325 RepID=A0A097AQU2_THEKI|nr:sporulation protein YqfD [Thermoanaerobacter kivui]AIS52179.1 putative stage IV sporulation protein [Thermoanaerobacter kivui]
MLAIKLWNFFRGYAIIKVEGLAIEKFLNLIMANDIYIWDVERKSYTTIVAKVSLRGFKEILPYARKTNCRVFVLSKKGFPFLALHLKRRKMLVFGALLCFVLIYIFSTFIWRIEVEAVNNVDKEVVIEKLSKLGLKPGISKFAIDIDKLETQFLIENDNVSWIGINVKGTNAFVKVIGKVKPKEVLSKDEPCNIIAKRDGIIYKMTVLEGEAVKKVGDTVKAGDIIVTGIIEKPGLETRFVHANAEVIARTWYEVYADVELKKQVFERTNNSITITKIILGNNTITISPKKVDFKTFDKEEKSITPPNFPVKIVKEVYHETKAKTLVVSYSEAQNIAFQKALENLKNVLSKDSKIVGKKENATVIQNRILRANLIVEVLENIGIEEKISYIQEGNID